MESKKFNKIKGQEDEDLCGISPLLKTKLEKEWIKCKCLYHYGINSIIGDIENYYLFNEVENNKQPIQFKTIIIEEKENYTKTEILNFENLMIENNTFLLRNIQDLYEYFKNQHSFYTEYIENITKNPLNEHIKNYLLKNIINKSQLKWLTFESISYLEFSNLCEKYFDVDHHWDLWLEAEDYWFDALQEILDWILEYKPKLNKEFNLWNDIMNEEDFDPKNYEWTSEDEEEFGYFFFRQNDRLY